MDYLIAGPQLKHYLAPKPVDLDGWDKTALAEVAREKIQELKDRFKEISELHDTDLTSEQKFRSGEIDCLRKQIIEYAYQEEKYYIELWLRYWQSFIRKPRVSASRLTDDDIARAKQFPLKQLYPGKIRHTGGKLVALCPFHQEKTPSFTIFPNNSYYCFGCHTQGDSITYLMESRNLGFVEAVRELI